MKKTIALIILFCGIFLIHCKKDNKVGETPNLTFTLYQIPDSYGGSLAISMDGGSYKYINVMINNTISVSSNNIYLKFTGTSCSNGNCIETPSSNRSATGTVLFGYLTNGSYNLTISINNKNYSGSVNVSNSKFKINLNASPAIDFNLNKSEINRIPINALWGDVNVYGSAPITRYFDTLSSIGVIPINLPSGDYGIFYINSSGQINSNGTDSTFIRSFNGNFNQISNISLYFKDSLKIHSTVYDGKGNHYQ